jgi:hypothetical protein
MARPCSADFLLEEATDSAMARTYREIAIEEMLRTVEEAMSQVIDWWGPAAASSFDLTWGGN